MQRFSYRQLFFILLIFFVIVLTIARVSSQEPVNTSTDTPSETISSSAESPSPTLSETVVPEFTMPTRKSPEPVIDPVIMFQEITKTNIRMSKYQAEITIIRQNPEFLKDIFPPMDNPAYVTASGVINFIKSPKNFNLLIYPKASNVFYYEFSSADGYELRLTNKYRELLFQTKESPQPGVITMTPVKTEDQEDYVVDYSKPQRITPDGFAYFSITNPLNLLFPLDFKSISSSQKLTYKGKTIYAGYRCHLLEIDDADFGKSMLYVSDDENNDILRIDRFNEKGVAYVTAIYRDFKKFRKGGRLFQSVEVQVLGQTLFTASLRNYRSNLDDEKLILTQGSVRQQREVGRRIHVKPPDIPFWQGQPLLTAGAAFLVIVLLMFLTILAYRFWFYKAERPAFAREVIVVEGDRPEDKISHLFADLGVPNTPFTPEKLTEERKLLDFKTKKKPRVLVIGPGMFTSVKAYNFLIKAFVEDGGRVIVFEHGVEQSHDMPFTPTFIPYDKSDPNYTFVVMPKWEKMWKQTSLEEIQKRAAAFYPYELLARLKEKTIEVDPIVVVTNQKVNITAAAICLFKEGKGEYLVIQYRLMEAIRKLKFTSATAEKMLRDLLSYMFGKEKRLDWAPVWVLSLFGFETGSTK